MKYLFYDESETVNLIYSIVPPKDLLDNDSYITVESLDEAEIKESRTAILKINKETKEPYYEYVDIPVSKEKTLKEVLQKRIEALEKSNAEMMNLITMQAMASTE